MSEPNQIVKNGLHFRSHGNGHICRELTEVPATFMTMWSTSTIEEAIDTFFTTVVGVSQKRYATQEEWNLVPESDRFAQGKPIVESVISAIKSSGEFQAMSLFERFLYAVSKWWYYHPVLIQETLNTDAVRIAEITGKLAQKYLVPALPEQVRESLKGTEVLGAAVGFGHFALLFENEHEGNRYIVTDQQLIMLSRVHGYSYLDITTDGRPVARCVTERGGGRAFFDGTRLMTHDSFQTCAPKVVLVEGGYKVNSTRCTIINGVLYPLVDSDDKVAHTTGVSCLFGFFPIVGFTRKDQLDSSALAEKSAMQINFRDGDAYLGETRLRPTGVFQPSQTTLLENGFTRYEPSVFERKYRYDHVLVVDDKSDWLRTVTLAFRDGIPRLDTFRTEDKRAALQHIQENNPEALVLDVHLTADEEFDGLWIANQLLAKGYSGLIMLASSYGRETLDAMRVLIKGKVQAPGKNIDNIRLCLFGQE